MQTLTLSFIGYLLEMGTLMTFVFCSMFLCSTMKSTKGWFALIERYDILG